MGFRFRKRIRIAPGVNINISKSGVSTSIGGKGATVNIGKKGIRSTVGIPGSGMSYTSQLAKFKSGSNATDQHNGGSSLLPTLIKLVLAIAFIAFIFSSLK